jgi:eukaryotic-like serine/threonine-protein kinase
MTFCINPRCQEPQNSENAQFCQNCQSALLLKQRYRATKVLGEGGFGKTYAASDLGTQNKVIKVLIDNSSKAVELFQREAEVLSQLNNPGIPRVEPNSYIVFHPANSSEPVHCLVMEKVEGMNLRDYLQQLRQPIDTDTAKRWLKELVLILQEVHERGILHRDIKPRNIMFKPDGKLALIDFGAVREGTGTQVATAVAGGVRTEVASHVAGKTSVVSAGYTAPEQMNGQAMKQSDFYSLGRTFVFLLTGKEPSAISYDAYNDVLEWRKSAPNIEAKFAKLLDRMQSIQVKQRPKNADEILDEILHILQGNSASTGRSPSSIDGEDIELTLDISAQEAETGISKDITFERIVYPSGSVSSISKENKTLTVKVPPGSAHGKRLRLAGQGNAGLNGGNAGNVYFCLNIASNYTAQPDRSGIVHAEFWKRFTASLLDMIVIIASCFFLPSTGVLIGYLSMMEASHGEGIYGKKMMSIVITNERGQKISHWKASVRNAIKFTSIAFFGIGIIYFIFSMLFSQKKQAIHDRLTGCIVVKA